MHLCDYMTFPVRLNCFWVIHELEQSFTNGYSLILAVYGMWEPVGAPRKLISSKIITVFIGCAEKTYFCCSSGAVGHTFAVLVVLLGYQEGSGGPQVFPPFVCGCSDCTTTCSVVHSKLHVSQLDLLFTGSFGFSKLDKKNTPFPTSQWTVLFLLQCWNCSWYYNASR